MSQSAREDDQMIGISFSINMQHSCPPHAFARFSFPSIALFNALIIPSYISL